MNQNDIVMIVEDIPKYAIWQKQAMEGVFPDKEIIHAKNLKEAHDTLNNSRFNIYAILTDNGYPLMRGGERIGSRSIEGGAGTLLIKQVRSGKFGSQYQDIPIAWHTAQIDDRKISRVMGYEDETSQGHTKCFEKQEGVDGYKEMGDFLNNI